MDVQQIEPCGNAQNADKNLCHNFWTVYLEFATTVTGFFRAHLSYLII